ncbi:ethylene-responsive transcription factor ERF017-like [Papaver somniferum]|uniref:ethylene-responsive transcription factor ERF017-like n=1 Tax=Papaver somniferum TaxID=3469 RepID=UPI000E6F48D7|nr:ethylene-responsive transcription factor ERF017-like [Papaver somniferum]
MYALQSFKNQKKNLLPRIMTRNDAVDNSSSSLSPSLRISKSRDQSKYRGITKRKWGKWVSEIRLPNSRERIWLGSHDKPEKAARAFDAAQFCLRGQGAKFNFPDNPPNIQGASSLSRAEIQEVAAKYANEEEEDNEAENVNLSEKETTIDNNGNNGNVDRELLDLLSVWGGTGNCTSTTVNTESDFCDYSGAHDFPGDIFALTSPQRQVCGDYGDENDGEVFYNHSYGDENDGGVFYNHSSLWDF